MLRGAQGTDWSHRSRIRKHGESVEDIYPSSRSLHRTTRVAVHPLDRGARPEDASPIAWLGAASDRGQRPGRQPSSSMEYSSASLAEEHNVNRLEDDGGVQHEREIADIVE